MHEIARHVIHSSETIAMALETLTDIVLEHTLFTTQTDLQPVPSRLAFRHTNMAFRSHVSVLKCLNLRSKALEERLKNEINLHDSRIAVRIGEATQVDSAAMKTISILGLALFSTSFFNFSPATSTTPQRWDVSERFWVYWVVAVPLTLGTVASWVAWQRVYARDAGGRG
ncbi:hypothetical protein LOCC1_G008053 [Lachnellula occidentalis]|uniref:Uncharacterized protein n=1 Tax=Lachnellula occidentalis TaxID=215460 RepID=A0A8H8RGC7_9HELO|nr:hypothetical protein LOCC1_G008053 [Lachnellula occidentalis]